MEQDQTAPTGAPATTETKEFSAEVGRLLDLVVNALYSEREIFLRELVANAADAVDRRRFLGLTDPALALPADAGVIITPDKNARQITISDDGLGMTRDELVANLGTIARSGTRAFGETVQDAKPEERPSLIGQFGVGFYSAFMVSERVEVISRRAGSDEAWSWRSAGRGSFDVSPAERATPGTDIILHIKADADEFLEPMRLQTIIRKWADHISVPIKLVRDGKAEAANEGTALWRKPKAEVTPAEYEDFYRHLGHFFDKPWATLHWRAEGALEYSALLFVPEQPPFDPVEGERTSKVRLHVRRMFITDEAELLPPWLRFVQGVVDTEDLPLNVSREMLQTTPVMARIRKAVQNRVLTELKSKAKAEAKAETAPIAAEDEDAPAADPVTDGYIRFWESFGTILKEGLWEDAGARADIAPLLRFHSSTEDGWTSLADYVARMKPDQTAIYFLAGETIEQLRHAPVLEGYRARGFEVLLMTDSIDAFWPERMGSFEDKPLRNARQALADLGDAAEVPEALKPLIDAMTAALADEIAEVQPAAHLSESPVMLVSGTEGADLHMQKLLRRAGRPAWGGKPHLTINPRHPWIEALAALAAKGEPVEDEARLLLDLARVQEGEGPVDPSAFIRRVVGAITAGRTTR
ncbi:molecular chaperone HtpG [Acidisoma cellulosilytica]|uniref:Chaperone protein HtpG n=1 Tax=Acidisoma cellulosilyticum TaxID=2802395 RepID=A0A963Z651_9PROT|nr:molecular chaperone HtpG [Acidisoma cellulosilyticum]MCB8883269.1 molecular chaperone HtpG [Acidisoma cellulosilyticum]